jgi:hypothetical protein
MGARIIKNRYIIFVALRDLSGNEELTIEWVSFFIVCDWLLVSLTLFYSYHYEKRGCPGKAGKRKCLCGARNGINGAQNEIAKKYTDFYCE